MVTRSKTSAQGLNRGTNEQVHVASEEEWRALVDRAARFYLDMSGDDFVRAWQLGEFENADRPEVLRVAMLLPLG